MAKVNNSEVIQKLIDELELYPGQDIIPTEVADKILPTFQINAQEVEVKNPTANIVRNGTMTDTTGDTTVTLYTVPSTGEFYLTGITLHHEYHDALDTSAIRITIDGTDYYIGKGFVKTATSHKTVNINFSNPILLDPESTVLLYRGAANHSLVDGTIIGYTQTV